MYTTADVSDPFYFITLKGQVLPFRQTIEELDRSGVDGTAFRYRGAKAESFELIGISDEDDFNSADATVSELRAYAGLLVNIVLDSGGVYTNVMCLDVQKVDKQPLVAASGGTYALTGSPVPTCLLTVRMKFRQTNVPTDLPGQTATGDTSSDGADDDDDS